MIQPTLQLEVVLQLMSRYLPSHNRLPGDQGILPQKYRTLRSRVSLAQNQVLGEESTVRVMSLNLEGMSELVVEHGH